MVGLSLHHWGYARGVEAVLPTIPIELPEQYPVDESPMDLDTIEIVSHLEPTTDIISIIPLPGAAEPIIEQKLVEVHHKVEELKEELKRVDKLRARYLRLLRIERQSHAESDDYAILK